ncbi:MAG: MBOAT family O-acyltransferase [Bacteroidota bacterium]
MLFNSIEFALFLPFVFLVYWFPLKGKLQLQNLFLLAASYFFYGWWDWRFLGLIILSSFLDFSIGKRLAAEPNDQNRKILLWISLAFNLGMLGFFKYYNFFVDSFVSAFTLLGQPMEPSRLEILLPVGISFYTFQTLSYTIDVYRRKLEPSKDIISFFTFVSFFPQLVAGPIERAENLLPQFYKNRDFDLEKAKDGLRQILWGLFKKIVIADNCALYANQYFGAPDEFTGVELILGAIFFSFQIYGDFSGYSDIAIGTAKLLGFDLMQNFATPYFARDMGEFWRRWHISLSTWFRDYLYIPLGGSRGGKSLVLRNTFIIFMVSGFWHGANWTFIIWGAIHALLFLPLILTGKNRSNLNVVAHGKLFPSIKEVFSMGSTFLIVSLAWIFFRAESVGSAIDYLSAIFSSSLFNMPSIGSNQLILFAGIFLLLGIEWVNREKPHPFTWDTSLPPVYVRWTVYSVFTWIIILFGGAQQTFIYFQF